MLAATAILPSAVLAEQAQSYPSADALRFYAQGRILEEQGQRVEAMGAYYRALALDPKAPGLALTASELAAELGEHRRSLELADRALGQSPGDARGLWLRGAALFNLDRAREALDPLIQAARADSNRVTYLYTLGRVAEQIGRLDWVVWSYRNGVRADPFDGEMWFQLAAVEARLGNFGAADTAMARAEELNPLRPGALFLSGWILESLGRPEEAIARYEEHLEVHPVDMTTRERLMHVLANEGLYKQAWEQALIVSGERPGDLNALEMQAHIGFRAGYEAKALETLGLMERQGMDRPEVYGRVVTVLARNGRTSEARQHFERWKIRNPHDYRGPLAAATVAAGRQEPELAIGFAREAVEAAPDSLAPRAIVAQAYQAEQMWDAASDSWREVLVLAPDNTPAAFSLAFCREQMRDLAGAEEAVRDVLGREPDNPDALNFLGYLFADHNVNLQEAEALIGRAIEFEPDNGAFIDSLGWVYYRLGRLEAAREQLERAVGLTNGDPVVHEHLGDVYKDMELNELAHAQYRMSLAGDADNERVRGKLQQTR
jgi:tetratricopeptide (TPR) repeat protein